jgi:hypothetical protein
MNPSNSKLLALAVAALLAAPLALAGDKPPTKDSKAKAAATQTVKTPTTSTSSASDAVSNRATARESGRVAQSPLGTNTGVGATNPPPGKGNWWADADIDGDGKLSAAEAKANAGVDARFGTIDANGDGYLTSDEYRSFFTSDKSQGELHAQAHSAVVTRDVWTKLDANADGKLSSSEVGSNSSISGAFSAMDGNGDGFVTQDEYRAYAKKNL